MHYLATVRTGNGSASKIRVYASDRRGAAKELKMAPSRILSVNPNILGFLSMSVFSKGPSKSEQAVLLHNLSAQLDGRSVRELFERYLKNDTRFKIDTVKFERATEIEDFLDALGFEKNVVLLAQAGRLAGNLKESLVEAANYLQEEEERKGAVAKKVAQGIIYSTVAVLMAVFGSMGFAGQLRNVEDSLGTVLHYNVASNILFALDSFFTNYGLLVLAALILCFVFRARLFHVLRNFPIIKDVDRIQQVKRGLNFLSAFGILRRADFTDKAALEHLVRTSNEKDAKIYKSLADLKGNGERLYEGLRSEDWPPSIISGLGQMEDLSFEDLQTLLKAMIQGLKHELNQATSTLATKLEMLGLFVLLAAVLVCITGFMLPIFSATGSPT